METKTQKIKNKILIRAWMLLAVSTVVLNLLYSNCSNQFTPDSKMLMLGNLDACEEGLYPIFSQQLYPFVTSKCLGCHSSGGESGQPFADSNIEVAFHSFMSVGMTKFSSYALNPSHQIGITGTANEPVIQAVQSQWNPVATGPTCQGLNGTDRAVTAAMSLKDAKTISPSTTSASAFSTLSWNIPVDFDSSRTLSSLLTSSYGSAQISILVGKVTSASGSTSYYITQPKLTTGTMSVTIKSLSIYINNKRLDDLTTFSGINSAQAPGQSNILATGTAVADMETGFADTDNIQIGIGSLIAK